MADFEADNALPPISSDAIAPGGYRLLAVIVFGVLLYAPSLWWGFFTDDYGHQIILQGIGEHPTMRAWSLYDFGAVPPKESPAWQSGGYPWWTDSDWRVSFFRPLTSVSLWVDHLIYDDWAVGFHITSLLLFGILLYLLYRLYLELGLSGRTALLALWLFAAADSSLFPVGWPATLPLRSPSVPSSLRRFSTASRLLINPYTWSWRYPLYLFCPTRPSRLIRL